MLLKCGVLVQLWLREGKPKGLRNSWAKDGRVARQGGRLDGEESLKSDEWREQIEGDLPWSAGGAFAATPKKVLLYDVKRDASGGDGTGGVLDDAMVG